MSKSGDRRPFIGGNWKSNGTPQFVSQLITELNDASFPSGVEVAVAPTYLALGTTLKTLNKKYIVSAQNCSRTGDGAFTGEISAQQLVGWGVKWVILGHSERRAYYGEDSKVVGEKVGIALKNGLSVIACIGETLDERKANKTLDVVTQQLDAIAGFVSDWSRVVVAYEPVWAIGTGLNATPAQAQEVHLAIRKWLRSKAGQSVSDATRIIYGGSVKGNNCVELIACPDIDGFLVGGASLSSKEFVTIMNSPNQKPKSKL